MFFPYFKLARVVTVVANIGLILWSFMAVTVILHAKNLIANTQ